MLKIGIITIVNVNNYGAELQAFALNRKLTDLGYDNEIIDYLYYILPKYEDKPQSKPLFKINIKNKIKWKILKSLNFIVRTIWSKEAKNRNEKFTTFHKKHTKLSKPYTNIDQLYNSKMIYDIYMVGSDQVWNPQTQTSLLPYFLTFAPKDKKKIAYAPSFGESNIPIEGQIIYKEYLSLFDSLSSREKRGAEMIKEITGREATHVLDPTVLLAKEEWLSVANLPNLTSEQPYILIYVITYSPYIKKFAEFLSAATGYRLIRICKSAGKEDSELNTENITDAGPSEFLGYFSQASMVVSNSFHGTIFSTKFNKPFFTVVPAHKTNTVRQRDYLNLLGLENRLIEEGANFPDVNKLDIDFTQCNKIMASQIEKSLLYLINAIEN